MDDNLNSQLFAFDSPLNQSSYIKVIGVGGGGNNAVNHMYQKGISGVDFIVSNTDMKALDNSPVPNKLPLGNDGMGAGGRPSKARKAAEQKEADIKKLLSENTKMVFITAGMGGGTGTGAAPVIARFAKEIDLHDEDEDESGKILVVAVVTTPFKFEGRCRLQQAQEGVEELRKYVDSILVIDNEKLRYYGNLVMSDAFAMANDVLLTAVKGIAEIITLNAYVNIDFRDVNTVMEHSGTALMGIGEGEGENRARQAVEQAATSVLLNDNDIAGAKNVLLYFSYGPEHEITMDEMNEVTDYLCEKTGSLETNVIWGTGFDPDLGEKVKITLIATGFEQKEVAKPQTVILQPENPPVKDPVAPAVPGEPHIVTRTEPVAETPAPAPVSAPQDVVSPVQTPVAAPHPQPVAEPVSEPTGTKHVIPLYEEAPAAPENPRTDNLPDYGMHLVNRPDVVASTPAAAPVSEPVSAPVSAPAAASYQPPVAEDSRTRMAPNPLDVQAMDRADRIKAMHDLLRNNPNAAEIVGAMNPAELTGERIYQAGHSSESEVAGRSVSSNGSLTPNPYLYSAVD